MQISRNLSDLNRSTLGITWIFSWSFGRNSRLSDRKNWWNENVVQRVCSVMHSRVWTYEWHDFRCMYIPRLGGCYFIPHSIRLQCSTFTGHRPATTSPIGRPTSSHDHHNTITSHTSEYKFVVFPIFNNIWKDRKPLVQMPRLRQMRLLRLNCAISEYYPLVLSWLCTVQRVLCIYCMWNVCTCRKTKLFLPKIFVYWRNSTVS